MTSTQMAIFAGVGSLLVLAAVAVDKKLGPNATLTTMNVQQGPLASDPSCRAVMKGIGVGSDNCGKIDRAIAKFDER